MRIIVTWDTIPPVVKIVSPLANSAIAADVVPIHWTIDGVAQTTDTLFTLGDGANRVERRSEVFPVEPQRRPRMPAC